MKNGKEFDWFDRPGVRRGLWRALCLACLVALVGEFFVKRKGHFGIDGMFGFFALLGFVTCVVAIFLVKVLGVWLRRSEDYYGPEDAEDMKPEDVDESL
ncbi:MAG: hypothetical protein AAGD22_05200 [Verrucomicrobiota bacterium]